MESRVGLRDRNEIERFGQLSRSGPHRFRCGLATASETVGSTRESKEELAVEWECTTRGLARTINKGRSHGFALREREQGRGQGRRGAGSLGWSAAPASGSSLAAGRAAR